MRHIKFLNIFSDLFWLYFVLIFITFLNVQRNCTVEAYGFNYPEQRSKEHPHWTGKCHTGRRQSPISLSDDAPTIVGELTELVLKDANVLQKSAVITHIGHTIRISNLTKEIYISGGPLLFDNVIDYIEFRWWAEHNINNVIYPLECQIFCRNKLYENMEAALEYNDGVTIIAVLYHPSMHENYGLKSILRYMYLFRDYSQYQQPVKMGKFRLSDLVPHLSSFFTYRGSLSTPPCTETITWIVLKDTFPVEWSQLEALKQLEYDRGKLRRHNFRYRQAMNNRTVLFVDNDRFWAKHALSGCNDHRKFVLTCLSIILVHREKFL